MNIFFKKTFRFINEFGFFAIVKEINNYIIVQFKKLFTRDLNHFGNWEILKNKYKGKRVFLIGNGPSLNKTPMYLLKNEYTLCFNRFNIMLERLDWIPTFFTTVDERVAEDNSEDLNNMIKKIKYCFFPDIHPQNSDFRKFIKKSKNIYWLDLVRNGFYKELPKTGMNGTVANVGIQILAYLGFKEIYLIGVDMDYKTPDTVIKNDNRKWTSTSDDDPNHFDPRYFGEGKKYHRPRINDLVHPGYKKAKTFTEKLGIKIYNAGYGGKLEVFERVNFRKLFNISKEEEIKLFLEIFNNKQDNKSIIKAFPDALIIDTKDKWDDKKKYIISDYDTGIEILQQAIFTHIPFGPVLNQYLFLRR